MGLPLPTNPFCPELRTYIKWFTNKIESSVLIYSEMMWKEAGMFIVI